MKTLPKNSYITFPSFGMMFKKFNPTLPRFTHVSLNALPIFLLVSNLKFSIFLKALFLSLILFSLYSIKFDLIFDTGLIKLSLKKLDLKSFGIIILFFFKIYSNCPEVRFFLLLS